MAISASTKLLAALNATSLLTVLQTRPATTTVASLTMMRRMMFQQIPNPVRMSKMSVPPRAFAVTARDSAQNALVMTLIHALTVLAVITPQALV